MAVGFAVQNAVQGAFDQRNGGRRYISVHLSTIKRGD